MIKTIYIIQHKSNFGEWIDYIEPDSITRSVYYYPMVSQALEVMNKAKRINYYPNWRVIGRMTLEFEVK